jgi:hypothetical protein
LSHDLTLSRLIYGNFTYSYPSLMACGCETAGGISENIQIDSLCVIIIYSILPFGG